MSVGLLVDQLLFACLSFNEVFCRFMTLWNISRWFRNVFCDDLRLVWGKSGKKSAALKLLFSAHITFFWHSEISVVNFKLNLFNSEIIEEYLFEPNLLSNLLINSADYNWPCHSHSFIISLSLLGCWLLIKSINLLLMEKVWNTIIKHQVIKTVFLPLIIELMWTQFH